MNSLDFLQGNARLGADATCPSGVGQVILTCLWLLEIKKATRGCPDGLLTNLKVSVGLVTDTA